MLLTGQNACTTFTSEWRNERGDARLFPLLSVLWRQSDGRDILDNFKRLTDLVTSDSVAFKYSNALVFTMAWIFTVEKHTWTSNTAVRFICLTMLHFYKRKDLNHHLVWDCPVKKVDCNSRLLRPIVTFYFYFRRWVISEGRTCCLVWQM